LHCAGHESFAGRNFMITEYTKESVLMSRRLWRVITPAISAGIILFGMQLWGCSPKTSETAQPPQSPPAVAAAPAPPAATPSRPSDFSLHEPAQRAMPAVVNIFTAKRLRTRRPGLPEGSPLRRFFGEPPDEPRTATSLGSGVIVTKDGLILTNNHVIEGADEIAVVVSAGNRRVAAKIVGADPDTDLAVIKADADNLTPITFGDSERLQVGDFVLAIGDPFGVGQTVTMGIVSATGRNRLGINPIENFIQTDAPINPGNSGGALVDVRGELVGINSAIYSESGGSLGIGFAIPVSMAKQVMEQLVKTGRVNRGWLGVQMEEIAPERAKQLGLPDQTGALVAAVVPGGPAERAGLRAGDVVRIINGKPIADSGTLLREITALAPGQTAELTIWRNGKEQQVKLEVGQRPTTRAAR
jgi:serine protease DegQ